MYPPGRRCGICGVAVEMRPEIYYDGYGCEVLFSTIVGKDDAYLHDIEFIEDGEGFGIE
jgi:hypothetical protein